MSVPMRQSCPICGRGPRDKTLIVWPNGQVHCHRGRDWHDIKAALGEGYRAPENSAPDAPKRRWSDKTDDEIPALVLKLEAARKTAGQGGAK